MFHGQQNLSGLSNDLKLIIIKFENTFSYRVQLGHTISIVNWVDEGEDHINMS